MKMHQARGGFALCAKAVIGHFANQLRKNQGREKSAAFVNQVA